MFEFVGDVVGGAVDRVGSGVSGYFDGAHKGFLIGGGIALALGLASFGFGFALPVYGTVMSPEAALGLGLIGGFTGAAGGAVGKLIGGLAFGSGKKDGAAAALPEDEPPLPEQTEQVAYAPGVPPPSHQMRLASQEVRQGAGRSV